MIGLSGYINFDMNENIKNFHDSKFIHNLKLKSKRFKRDNIYVNFLDHNFKNSIFCDDNCISIVVGDIFDVEYIKSSKNKSKYIYNFYKTNRISEIPKIDGSFAFVIIGKNNTIFLGSDQNSFIPIFYEYKNKILNFSFDLWQVLKNQSQTKKINLYNFSSILLTGGIGLNDETKIKDISKLSAGNMLLIKNEISSLIIAEPFKYKSKDKGIKSHLNDVSNNLIDATSKRIKNKKNIGFGLSGGLDSRILAAALANFSSKNIYSFNYGRKEFSEKKIAQEVAQLFNIKYNDFTLPNGTHLKYIYDSIYYSGGESSITLAPQMHIHSTFKNINKIDTLMFGSFFDYTGGDSGINDDLLSFKKNSQLLNYYKNGHVLKYSENSFLELFYSKDEGSRHYEKILSDIKNNLTTIRGDNFADINISFYFQYRGKNWYNRHLSLPLLSNNLSIPFYGKGFLNSISQVPTSLRKNDTFRIRLLKKLNLEASNIKYDATMAPAWTEYPMNKKLKSIIYKEDEAKYTQWIKSDMSKKFRSHKNDANFLEWFSVSKSYQNFLFKILLDKKKSILINTIFSYKKINSILNDLISGKKNNLRIVLMLINLEISARIADGSTGPSNNKFVSFEKYL